MYKNVIQVKDAEIKVILAPEENKIEKAVDNRQSKIEDFYNEFVDGKFKPSLAQLEQIANLDDPEKMVTDLKTKHRIAKKDGVKLIDSV
jgi:hypothetical protein